MSVILPKVAVKLIYPTDRPMADPNYSTGSWEPGEVKMVTPETAAKLVKHIDVYALATPDEAVTATAVVAEVALDKGKEELEKLSDHNTQALRDDVNKMDRATAQKYGKEHYGLHIPGNLSTEDTRKRLIQHIDLAGAN